MSIKKHLVTLSIIPLLFLVACNTDLTDMQFIYSGEPIVNEELTVSLDTTKTDLEDVVWSLALQPTGSTATIAVIDDGKSVLITPDKVGSYRINVSSDDTNTSNSTVFEAFIPITPRPINDTGTVLCADYAWHASNTHNNNVNCASTGATQTTNGTETTNGLDVVPAAQDALHGRDVTHNDNTDGHAGFSFTKLDSNGDVLADQSQDYATNPWSCVKDNVTGLTWETKTDSGLQDKSHTYTWYNSTGINDGGEHGIGDTGVSTTTNYEDATSQTAKPGSDACLDAARCDTEKLAADINTQGLCGASDWRVPTYVELISLSNFNQAPHIDTNYFPNTQTSEVYWSASALADDVESPGSNTGKNDAAWALDLKTSRGGLYKKEVPKFVRLVR